MEIEHSLLGQLVGPIALFFIALSCRAIFSFLETSITALRLFRLREIAVATGRYAALFQVLEHNPHRVLITTIVASNFADVTVAAISTYIVETIFEHFDFSRGIGFSVGIGTASIMLLIFGEILPKNLARRFGDRMFNSMLWLINLVYRLLSPLTNILIRFSDAFMQRMGSKDVDSGEQLASEREVQFLINYVHQQGLMEAEKSEMLRNVFDLGSTPIREIMVPATDIVSISADTNLQDALNKFLECHFTRLPVFDKESDNIIGMAHHKDLFFLISNKENKTLRDIIRPILFVPDSMKVNQLLRELRQQHMHIAIVLNEYGIVTGLITLEDVLEEIVGDINDEYEMSTQKITVLREGEWLIDASIALEELEEKLAIEFESENAVTLGGFLTERLQHVPKKGEQITYKDYIFHIQKASTRRVQQVLIEKKIEGAAN